MDGALLCSPSLNGDGRGEIYSEEAVQEEFLRTMEDLKSMMVRLRVGRKTYHEAWFTAASKEAERLRSMTRGPQYTINPLSPRQSGGASDVSPSHISVPPAASTGLSNQQCSMNCSSTVDSGLPAFGSIGTGGCLTREQLQAEFDCGSAFSCIPEPEECPTWYMEADANGVLDSLPSATVINGCRPKSGITGTDTYEKVEHALNAQKEEKWQTSGLDQNAVSDGVSLKVGFTCDQTNEELDAEEASSLRTDEKTNEELDAEVAAFKMYPPKKREQQSTVEHVPRDKSFGISAYGRLESTSLITWDLPGEVREYLVVEEDYALEAVPQDQECDEGETWSDDSGSDPGTTRGNTTINSKSGERPTTDIWKQIAMRNDKKDSKKYVQRATISGYHNLAEIADLAIALNAQRSWQHRTSV